MSVNLEKTSNIGTISLDDDDALNPEEIYANYPGSTQCITGLNDTEKMNGSQLVIRNKVASIDTNDNSLLKSGEIFRSNDGRFIFLCSLCNAVNYVCDDMLMHINGHFDENIDFTSPVPSPEFVSCAVTEAAEKQPKCVGTFRELTNTISSSKHSQETVTKAPVTLAKSGAARCQKRQFSPKFSVEDLLASRPCKIRRIIEEDAPATSKVEDNSNIQLNPPNNIDERKNECDPRTLKCRRRIDLIISDSDSKRHQCRECRKWFQSHLDYRSHFLKTHLSRTVKCYQCEMEPPVTNESDARRHKCAICKEWFPNHIEFKTHLKEEHDEDMVDNDFSGLANDYKEFTCYLCERNLKQEAYLAHHMKGHFEKFLEYQCHQCGLRVASVGVLKEHLKRHERQPTPCDLCNRVFSNNFKMRCHRQSHTTELKYECKICSKKFKLRKYLTRHQVVHKEVKLACRYCDANFKWSTGRRAHEKSVHNVL